MLTPLDAIGLLLALLIPDVLAINCFCEKTDAFCGPCQYCSYQEQVNVMTSGTTVERHCLTVGAVPAGNVTVYSGSGCVQSFDSTKGLSLRTYVCNYDFCNDRCGTTSTPAPTVPSHLTCYSCAGSSDCSTNTVDCVFDGRPGYCVYVRKETNDGTINEYYKKTCNSIGQAVTDDGHIFNYNDGLCQTRISNVDSRVMYHVKICNTDYCNGQCPASATTPTTSTNRPETSTRAAGRALGSLTQLLAVSFAFTLVQM